jgi:CheY-like chemotaxis protein
MNKKTNILLIDDDADDRLLFVTAAAEIGSMLECSCAGGTSEAMNYLNRAEPLPDVIFLDMNMPGYDGKRCLLQVKSSQRLKDIPVIIYSTFISQETENEMLRLGASSVITKPGDFNSIQIAILKCIQSLNVLPQ